MLFITTDAYTDTTNNSTAHIVTDTTTDTTTGTYTYISNSSTMGFTSNTPTDTSTGTNLDIKIPSSSHTSTHIFDGTTLSAIDIAAIPPQTQ